MVAFTVLLPLLALSCAALLALDAVRRRLPATDASARILVAATLVLIALAWSFQLLALAGLFRYGVLVGLTLGLLAASWWRRHSLAACLTELRADVFAEVASMRTAVRRPRWLAFALVALCALVTLRIARVLVTPTVGWDDFTYHLYRAGLWVQDGGIVLHPAPDAWTYYEFFGWGGDLVWAWALAWRTGDGLVPFSAVGIWALCWLGGFVLAGRLGQPMLNRVVVATTLVLLPSQLSLINTAYVDNTLLLLSLSAAVLLLELSPASHPEDRSPDTRRTRPIAFLLGGACGLAILVKLTGLALLGTAGLLVGWLALRRRQVGLLVGFGLGATVAIPNLVFNWAQRGSPFYPFRVIPGLPYNELQAETFRRFGSSELLERVASALRDVVVNPVPEHQFLNPGWSGALLFVAGCVGLWRLRKTAPLFVCWALAGLLFAGSQLFSPSNSSLLSAWGGILGRLLAPSLAGVLVAAGSIPSRWCRWILVPLVVEALIYAPRRWPPSILVSSLVVVVAALLLVLGLRFLRGRVERRVLALAAATGVVLWMTLGFRLHDHNRWTTYSLLVADGLDDYHPAPPAVFAWPMWKHLEEVGPTTMAVTAGWDGASGHNWFLWPLLGSHLQNRLVYLPITEDGSLVSYQVKDVVTRAADRRAWLERLGELGPEWVAALGPPSREYWWIVSLPEIFQTPGGSPPIGWTLARVDHEALAEALATEQ